MSNIAPTDSRPRVAVMGSGSWGTAFALVVSDADNRRDPVGPASGACRQDQHRTSQPRLLFRTCTCRRP